MDLENNKNIIKNETDKSYIIRRYFYKEITKKEINVRDSSRTS